MGDDDGAPPGQHPFEQPPQQRSRVDVQGGQGLIQQQHLRIHGQGTGRRHALRLPAGQLPRPAVGEVGGVDLGQPVPGSLPGLPLGHPRAPRPEGDVFERAQVRKQQGILGQQGGAAAVRRGPGVHAGAEVEQDPPVHLGPAGVRAQQPGDHREQGGFSRPVGAEHGHRLARRQAQRHVKAAGGEGGVERERHAGTRPGAPACADLPPDPAGAGPR